MKNYPLKMACVLSFFLTMGHQNMSAQETDRDFFAGVRIQKTHQLYFENGITLNYSSNKLWDKRIHLGLSYVTSRLGTAFHSNALKQDNYLASLQFNFRRAKIASPIVKLNAGYFYVDLENPIFSDLPHTSALLSVESGIEMNLKLPIKPQITFGYNFITGDGLSGPGTLFPLFFQLSISYKIL